MVKKAIKGFIIAMSVLMLGGAYPNPAFAMECAENSESNEVRESSESPETSDPSGETQDSGSCGQSEDSSCGQNEDSGVQQASDNCDITGYDSVPSQDQAQSIEMSAGNTEPVQTVEAPANPETVIPESVQSVQDADPAEQESLYVAASESQESAQNILNKEDKAFSPDCSEDKNFETDAYINKEETTSDDQSYDRKNINGQNSDKQNSDNGELAETAYDDEELSPKESGSESEKKDSADGQKTEETKEPSDSGSAETEDNNMGSSEPGDGNSEEAESSSAESDGTDACGQASEGALTEGVLPDGILIGDLIQNRIDNENELEADQKGGADDTASFAFVKTELYKSGLNKTENDALKEEEFDTEPKNLEEKEGENNQLSYIDKFIYNDQKYILGGGESADLSGILASVGLEGEITEVSVSDENLFSVTNENGSWIIYSHQPFETEEWMKVTIDGVEYEIAVLDDAADPELEDISAYVPQSQESDFMRFSVVVANPNEYAPLKSFNIEGKFNRNLIKTTYSNAGYTAAISVNGSTPYNIRGNSVDNKQDFAYGKVYTFDGVQIRITASMADDGKAVAIKYELHNKNATSVTVKFGSSADTQIGSNDSARVEFSGNTIIMEDDNTSSTTYGAKYMLYPGNEDFTTKWRGLYLQAYGNIFNNYSGEDPLTKTDSGIAWSWTAEILPYETISRTNEFAVYRNGWSVTFNGNGGTPVKTVRPVSDGGTVTPPAQDPIRKGYEFKNWCESEEGGTPFDFDTTISADKDLYADWEFLPPTVTGANDLELVYGYEYDDENSVSVTAETADDAELKYQWYSCNSPDGEGTALEGATGASYNIPAGKEIGNYYYYCNVTAENSKHTVSGPVKSGVATVKVTKRPITITADTFEKVYDGTPLTMNTYTLGGEGLAAGDEIDSVTIEGSQTIAGESDNEPISTVIKHGNSDVTGNYNITYVKGTLKVTQRPITITAESDEKVYDGTPLIKDTYTYSENGLAAGDKIDSVTIEGSRTDVGSSDNELISVVIKCGDTDVTGSYDISFENGKLEVTKRPITITANSGEKVYDGTPLTKDTYTLGGEGLADGDTIESLTIEGSRTYVGTGENKVTTAVIKRADEDVTGNYDITYAEGTLTVSKRKITVTAVTDEKTYDGTALINNNIEEGVDLATGDVFASVTVTGSRTDVGSSDNVVSKVLIKRGLDRGAVADRDVTENYDITFKSGTLTVTKRPITITADSDERVYDGTPLTKDSYTYEEGQLAQGDIIGSVTITGSRTLAGSSSNVVESAEIRREDDNADVTNNYEITFTEGTLTIIPRPITFTADSAEKVYDGTPLTKDSYTYDTEQLASTDAIEDITIVGSRTDVGSSSNTVREVRIKRDADGMDVTDCYEITFDDGILTVTKATATVEVPLPNNRTYDGTEQPLLTGGSTDFGYIEYALGTGDQEPDEDAYRREVPCGTNADEYRVWFRVPGTDNYNGQDPIPLDVTIGKAPMTVSAEGYTGEYDGLEHTIRVSVSNPDEAEIYYSTSVLNADNYREGSKEPVQRTDEGTTRVYYYVVSKNYEPDRPAGSSDIVIEHAEEPAEEPVYPVIVNGEEEEHGSHSLPNPDALHAWYLVNDVIVHTSKIGKIRQGPLAAGIFAHARNFLLNEAFSFDLSIFDRTEYTLKRGKIVMYIPQAFQKKGRVFAVLGLDKMGKVHLFTNVGIYENLLTVNVDFEGYAFDLVYIDT